MDAAPKTAANIKLLSILAFSLLLLTGCNSLPFTTNNPEPTVEDIYSGSEGLVIEFLENAPPETIVEGSAFKSGFNIKNKGASDIKKGYFLLGLEKEFLELYSWDGGAYEDRVTFDLKGKSLSLPDGDEDLLFANLDSRDIGIQREEIETTIFATACYDYQTIATAQVCIDTDPYDIKVADKACTASDISLSSQGAPVAVNDIEYILSVSRDEEVVKPQFTIHINNLGDGTIVTQGKSDVACSAKPLEKNDLNVIKISAALSGSELTCNPAVLKLTSEYDYTVCTLATGIYENQPNYYAPLEITLNYGYMQTISDTIKIKAQG